MTSAMITVALCGAEHEKAQVPQLPTTLDEVVETARTCEAAGAAMIHLHIRDDQHRPTLEVARLKEAVDAVRAETSLITQLSTGGSVHDSLESRLLVLDAGPDSRSLTCGTVNFGDDVFLNPWPFMSDLYVAAQERHVVPEFEIFDLGQLASLQRLIDTHGLPWGEKVHVDFVLGVPGGLPGTPAALMTAVAALPAPVTSWCATGIGRSHLPIMATALAAGGHVRVGMEDTLRFSRERMAASNAEFVQRAATMAELMQRPVLTPDAARGLLGMPCPARAA